MVGLLSCILLYLCGERLTEQMHRKGQEFILEQAQSTYAPSLAYLKEDQSTTWNEWLLDQISTLVPLADYVEKQEGYREETEDAATIAMILEMQANDENMIDENGNLVGEEVPSDPQAVNAAIDMSIEKLRDFEYLLTNFYTVDSTTMIDAGQLNVDDLLSRDMKIDQSSGGPKVLVFHTHSQEAFADSVPGDTSTTIVGVGEYLTALLNAKGIPTIHNTGVYDLIDGKLDRSKAYEQAEVEVRKILEENPSIEVVIDLHRDGVGENTHLVTEVNGKPTAKIMFFNGLSRTRTNGDIEYLYNPYIQDNLSFSFQMQMACETHYPGFARHIYLKGYRYSLHMMPKSLLIEAGAQTNTVEEMKNAMEVLADALYRVLIEGKDG
ncbi:MAG: stage II sporulation protein P [Hespellia sp.]|nr:stage II sporulation protein P [Hespellia sp.]